MNNYMHDIRRDSLYQSFIFTFVCPFLRDMAVTIGRDTKVQSPVAKINIATKKLSVIRKVVTGSKRVWICFVNTRFCCLMTFLCVYHFIDFSFIVTMIVVPKHLIIIFEFTYRFVTMCRCNHERTSIYFSLEN